VFSTTESILHPVHVQHVHDMYMYVRIPFTRIRSYSRGQQLVTKQATKRTQRTYRALQHTHIRITLSTEFENDIYDTKDNIQYSPYLDFFLRERSRGHQIQTASLLPPTLLGPA
jgi:hypothetical protein